jgi:hypothetical protein
MTYHRTTSNQPSSSPRGRLAVFATLAFATVLWSGTAAAFISRDDPDADWTNRFDLGIDVSDVVKTREGIRAFLATLAPETRRVIMATCEHYMERSSNLRGQDTIPFCSVAVEL